MCLGWEPEVSGRGGRTLVIPQMRQLGAQFIFVHDSALWHRANIVSKELNANSIMHLLWPACSSDLNPTEQAKAIHYIPEQPQTLVALENALPVPRTAVS